MGGLRAVAPILVFVLTRQTLSWYADRGHGPESCRSKKRELLRWLSDCSQRSRKVMVVVSRGPTAARVGLDGRRVRDAGADAALIVDALKVSLAVGRRGALVAIRALLRVGARAAADGDGIPIDVWVLRLVDGKLLRRAMGHHAEGAEHRRSLDKHFRRCTEKMSRKVLIEVKEVEMQFAKEVALAKVYSLYGSCGGLRGPGFLLL